jgi:hypothetical protein
VLRWDEAVYSTASEPDGALMSAVATGARCAARAVRTSTAATRRRVATRLRRLCRRMQSRPRVGR